MNYEDTSEAKYGIPKQPEPTCPLIDAAINEVVEMQQRIRGYGSASEQELRDMLDDIDYRLSALHSAYRRRGLLEDIRAHVEKVRSWGQDWKIHAKLHDPR